MKTLVCSHRTLAVSAIALIALTGCSAEESESAPAAKTSHTASASPIVAATEESSPTPAATTSSPTPALPLSYTKPFTFDDSGVSGTISRVDSPQAEDLAAAARDSNTDEGVWFEVELTNNSGAELRPQLINFHTSADEHYQAYGEVATSFKFASNAPNIQSVQDVKNKYARSGPLAAGENRTVYFYSPVAVPDGFETATIQFLAGGANLIIDLPANNL